MFFPKQVPKLAFNYRTCESTIKMCTLKLPNNWNKNNILKLYFCYHNAIVDKPPTRVAKLHNYIYAFPAYLRFRYSITELIKYHIN